MKMFVAPPLAAFLVAAPVSATERKHAPELPGVEEGYRIVDKDALTRSIEPEPDAIPNGPGYFKVGDWDVHISGEVSVTIGSGPIRDGR